jgi:leucyl-tRNA synthetase
MYEFSTRPVRCRCNTECMVKIVEDQWFLDYSNERWKERARKALEQMKLIPPEIRAQFQHTIEWLHEWPCTRKIGMGTPAPWDPNWTIESLSDSTIYMAYYTISHLLKGLDPSQLTDEVFDYVFYGKGEKSEIAKRTGIRESALDQMRSQFDYWYPVDYRMSANELIPNHLTFYVFHHAMIFPDRCPRGIVSFGMAVLEGEKMSSSKGNIVAINQAVKDHGADAVRFYLMSGVEPWQDFDWKIDEVKAMGRNLERFYSLATKIISLPPEEGTPTIPDRWMLSRLQRHIRTVTDSLEAFETRNAVQHAFFLLMRDVRWYMERVGNAESKSKVLKSVADVWLRLLAPFIPHLCEELWHQMGREGFVSVAPWPEVKEELIDQTSELVEDYISEVLQDVGKILKVVKVGKPKRVCFYVAPEWKWAAYRMALEEARKGELKLGELIRLVRRELATKFGFGPAQAELAGYLQTIVQKVGKLSEAQVETLLKGEINEFSTLEGAKEFIVRRLNLWGVRVDIFKADDPARYDLQGRARLAAPLRPAIYVE